MEKLALLKIGVINVKNFIRKTPLESKRNKKVIIINS